MAIGGEVALIPTQPDGLPWVSIKGLLAEPIRKECELMIEHPNTYPITGMSCVTRDAWMLNRHCQTLVKSVTPSV
ncbi:hypothetical protein Pyn_02361 [Prunus yedoensis var. nudiflora]|uniref:Uncharacterized protein n=1 Tax=Prunus yedoensis var. nudiflora TaxID=2094558 RepID=A0A314YFS0_PRUYE|nr:hypothetical protein Pyn_02361 [Prunus yedoensis var. nudiflora]